MKITILVLIAILLPGWAPSFCMEADELMAVQTARDLVDRALSVGSEELIPKRMLRNCVVDEVIFVHHPVTLEPSHGIVPIRSRTGRLIGLVGTDAGTGDWQWCTFSCRDDRFPAVSKTEGLERLSALKRSIGLEGEPPQPILIRGFDKHLYWHFESGGEIWLLDALRPDAAPLTSVDGSDRKAVTPPLLSPESGNAQAPSNTDLQAPGDDALLAVEIPPAYCLPGLPYHFQITSWYCGPASLQMMMDYLGEEIGQHNIADVADDVVGAGCNRTDMRRSAHFSGMSAAIQDPSLHGYAERQLGYACIDRIFITNQGKRLKNTVYAGYPVFTLTWFDGSHTAGHYRVVKGYDDSLDVFVIHDPWYFGSISGPDLLVNQTFFVYDLWAYSGQWCMVVSPWLLTPTVPASVSEGDTFSVDLEVVYPGPTRFGNGFTCSSCVATISLSPGLTLAGGTNAISLPDLSSDDTVSVSWDIVAAGPAGEWGMAFQAQGIVNASSDAYPSYTDSIGGHSYATVEIGGGLLTGWDAEERLTSDEASSVTCFPGARAMAVADEGTAHLVWADTRDENSEIYYRQRSESAWGTEVRLTSDPGHSHSPCIARGSDGGLHVAWVDDRDGNQEIYYKAWDPLGGWGADERVSTYGEVDCCPTIAAGDTAVYVAWERREGSAYRVASVRFSMRTTLGWTAEVDVDASPARDSYRPSIACGPDGIVHLVYERQTAGDPDEKEKIVHKSWDGLSWSSRTGLSSDLSFSRNPAIAAARDSTVHVVWQDGENVGGDIFYVMHDGSAWQPIEQIVTGGTEAGTPSIAAAGSDEVHVAWVDHRHGDSEIYLVSFDGAGWADEIRLSNAPGASNLPTVGVDTAGAVYVVWSDMRNGHADLYFRTTGGQSGVSERAPVAAAWGSLFLSAPHPVPAASDVRFTLTLAQASHVSVGVYDVTGRLVRAVAGGTHDAGTHEMVWDGRDNYGRETASGIYFIRCSGRVGQHTRRIVRIR